MSHFSIPRFVIGTAQFGMNYGVSNNSGQPSRDEVCKLTSHAIRHGFTWFDTAQTYGDSETVLGHALSDDSNNVTIITKLHPDLNPKDSDEIFNAIQDSCSRLNVSTIWGVMLHRSEWLHCWNDGLGDALTRAKGDGLIKHIGVSVYTPQETDSIFLFLI